MGKFAPYMKALTPEQRPEPCRQCTHRDMLRWLMDGKFCQYSEEMSTYRTKRCSDFEPDYGTQLSLF